MYRGLLFFTIFILFGCNQSGSEDEPSEKTLKPNVLLILTDDQGFGDVRVHGNDKVDTPVQDKLAKRGIRMDNFYVSPVCAPTRASLLTGRYHYRTGTTWVTRNGEAMRSEEVTLAELFKANGYATGCYGKWHNGGHYPQNPLGQGFDEFTGFCAGHWSNYFDPQLEANGQLIQTRGYITDILTDSALSFIQRHQKKPFFCYVPYNTPHTPYIVPDTFFDKYKARGLDDKLASTYGMVEAIDQNIGRMLAKLEELALDQNTLIIFITDNGPNYDRYNANLKGRKGWVNDGGVRVPCFMYWPGKIEGGKKLNNLTAHIDLLPTLQDLLKLKPVETLPLDGISFANLLTGDNTIFPDRSFFTFTNNKNKYKGGLRTQEYRLMVNEENNYELTKLLDDPGELNDLKTSMPELAEQMYQAYLTKYEEVIAGLDDFLPIPIGYKEAPKVYLQGHEAFFTGGIQYSTSEYGWANDWLKNWTATTDTIYWNVDVVHSGIYQASVQYSCRPEHVGSSIHLKAMNSEISAPVSKAHIPEFVPNFERVPREVEAVEQTWAIMPLGEIQLKAGRQRINLFANNISNGIVADVKALVLEQRK